MSAKELLHWYLDQCPLVAIIRGITPDEADAIGDAIFEGGIRIIEVPLNSPQPLKSIEKLAAKFGDRALVGAGTVLKAEDVARIREVGGRIIGGLLNRVPSSWSENGYGGADHRWRGLLGGRLLRRGDSSDGVPEGRGEPAHT